MALALPGMAVGFRTATAATGTAHRCRFADAHRGLKATGHGGLLKDGLPGLPRGAWL